MSTAPQIVAAKPAAPVRKCQQCGKVDSVNVQLADGIPVYHHTVRLELRYIDRAEDQPEKPGGPAPLHIRRMIAKGWKPAPIVPAGERGRKALQRFACVECIEANARASKAWAILKRDARALEQKQKAEENYYHILCDVEEA